MVLACLRCFSLCQIVVALHRSSHGSSQRNVADCSFHLWTVRCPSARGWYCQTMPVPTVPGTPSVRSRAYCSVPEQLAVGGRGRDIQLLDNDDASKSWRRSRSGFLLVELMGMNCSMSQTDGGHGRTLERGHDRERFCGEGGGHFSC